MITKEFVLKNIELLYDFSSNEDIALTYNISVDENKHVAHNIIVSPDIYFNDSEFFNNNKLLFEQNFTTFVDDHCLNNESLIIRTSNPVETIENPIVEWKPRNDYGSIILLGAPGSGKGSISNLIKVDNRRYVQISTGDILRDHIDRNTEIGKIAAENEKTGKLLDDDIIFDLIKEEIETFAPNQRFIFDGVIRTEAQAKMFTEKLGDRFNKDNTYIIDLEVDEAELIERITNRAQIQNRVDDSDIRIIRNRFKIYNENAESILSVLKDFYGADRYSLIEGNGDLDEVFIDVYDEILANSNSEVYVYHDAEMHTKHTRLLNGKWIVDVNFDELIKHADVSKPVDVFKLGCSMQKRIIEESIKHRYNYMDVTTEEELLLLLSSNDLGVNVKLEDYYDADIFKTIFNPN